MLITAPVANATDELSGTVRANTTSGFSIVTFTTNNTAGATVGHGLGAVPDMIIMKYRGLAANWVVYHKSMNATPQNGYLNLNLNAGGTGKVLQFGFETDIDDNAVSIQKVDVFVKGGKTL